MTDFQRLDMDARLQDSKMDNWSRGKSSASIKGQHKSLINVRIGSVMIWTTSSPASFGTSSAANSVPARFRTALLSVMIRLLSPYSTCRFPSIGAEHPKRSEERSVRDTILRSEKTNNRT